MAIYKLQVVDCGYGYNVLTTIDRTGGVWKLGLLTDRLYTLTTNSAVAVMQMTFNTVPRINYIY